jgi:hypothetical protein
MKANRATQVLALLTALTLGIGAAPAQAAEPTVTEAVSSETNVAPRDAAAIAAFKASMVDFKAAMVTYRSAMDNFKVQMEAYKLAMEEIKPALEAHNSARRTIGQTFAAAMTSARTAYKAVLDDSTATAEAKLAAKTTFETAKTAAVTARQAALTALGAAPTKPAKPEKPTKPVRPVRP